MSKRAEKAAKEIYKDGIELFGRRDKNGNFIIHPEIMVGILRNACQAGYEQAEKETIRTVKTWLSEIHRVCDITDENGYRVELRNLVASLEKTMEEE